MRSFSGKKTISSSSFLGWLAGRGAVKTLIDWYVRRRRHCRNASPRQHSSTVCGSNGWLLHGSRWQQQGCNVYVYATEAALRGLLQAAATVGCPAGKPSESPITARPILESCRRPLFFYIHVSHFEICSTFSAWLDILSAFPQTYYTTSFGLMHGNMYVAKLFVIIFGVAIEYRYSKLDIYDFE